MILGLGVVELVIIVVVLMLMFGLAKLPTIANALGRLCANFGGESRMTNQVDVPPQSVPMVGDIRYMCARISLLTVLSADPESKWVVIESESLFMDTTLRLSSKDEELPALTLSCTSWRESGGEYVNGLELRVQWDARVAAAIWDV